MSEKKYLNDRLLNLNPSREQLWRTNSGIGWTSNKTERCGRKTILTDARPFRAMESGWPDLTGFTMVKITPEMVGSELPVFTVEEYKTGKLSLSKVQKNYKKLFEKFNVIYRLIRCD